MTASRHVEHEWPADTGCDVSSSCLRCPLAACKHDDPAAYLRWKNRAKYDQVRQLKGQGLRNGVIASQLGIVRRTVQRRLHKGAPV